MISSEYGWTDEEIQTSTLKRVRQMVAAIRARKLAQLISRTDELKLICSFIAATVPTEDGSTNKLLEEAKMIGSFVDRPSSSLSDKEGSYERLITGFKADFSSVPDTVPAPKMSDEELADFFEPVGSWVEGKFRGK